jgi:hypothetical protein
MSPDADAAFVVLVPLFSPQPEAKAKQAIKNSGYPVCSTIHHMSRLGTYNHFTWDGTAIYGLLHQTVKN